jgi:signal transduction histidine kinase
MTLLSSIRRKTLAGYLMILCIFLLMGFLLIDNYDQLMSTVNERKQTTMTMLSVEHALDNLYIIEISQAGYLQTGNHKFLIDFYINSRLLEKNLQITEQYLQDDPEELASLKKLQTLLTDRLVILDKLLGTKKRMVSNAQTIEQFLNEKEWLEKVQPYLSEIIVAETNKLQGYDNTLEHQMSRSILLGIGLALFIVLILSSLYWNLHKEMLVRQEAQRREELAKEAAEESNRLKTSILGFVAHDFKNPLSAIARFVDILDRNAKNLTTQEQELLGYIRDGVQDLQKMVHNILDKVRIEEGKLTPSPQQIQIEPFLEQLIPQINLLAEPKKIEVVLDIAIEKTEIETDPNFLRHIIMNLASNAIKYNKQNGRVFIRFCETEDRQYLKIEVRDTGLGIPKDKLQEIFKPYVRLGGQAFTDVEGTGLGLGFVQKLAELLGGHIEVASEIEKGSIFTVWLPHS